MPRSQANVGVQERQLSNDETYALTAYILYINGIIGLDEVMDAESLVKVEIPIEKKVEE
jgi:S-disulfanyl-L-cysteine oxidoreductase SoxD